MPSLQQVLASIPFVGGYEAARQQEQAGSLDRLRRMGALSTLQAQLEARQREAGLRGALSGIPADATMEQVTRTLLPYAANADTALRTMEASRGRFAQIEATKEAMRQRLAMQAQAQIDKLEREAREEVRADRKLALMENAQRVKQMYDAASLRMTGERLFFDTGVRIPTPEAPGAPSAEIPATFNFRLPSGETVSGTAPSEGAAVQTGRTLLGGAPQPPVATAQALATAAMPPEIAALSPKARQEWLLAQAKKGSADVSIPSPSLMTAVPEGIEAPAATGGSGFFGGLANTIADMVGAGMPYPKVEQASQALKNLQVQTITMAQDAVPGRPSNYLMQQIEKLSVSPGSLLMADQRAKTRLEQTRDMLQQEVSRMEREILSRPQQHTAAQLSKTRNSFGQLRQLVSEYDRVIASFGGAAQSRQIPALPPGFKLD